MFSEWAMDIFLNIILGRVVLRLIFKMQQFFYIGVVHKRHTHWGFDKSMTSMEKCGHNEGPKIKKKRSERRL